MHTKSIACGKSKSVKWTTTPKGAVSRFEAMPLIDAIRSLGYADKSGEAKKIIQNGMVLVDGKPCKDPVRGLGFQDVIGMPRSGESYRVMMNKKGLALEKITKEQASKKSCRVIGKTILSKGKVQLNLHDGSNILSDAKVKVNDTVIIDLPTRNISKSISFEPGKQAIIISGRHRGETGLIEEVQKSTASRVSLTKIGDIETLTSYAFVTGGSK